MATEAERPPQPDELALLVHELRAPVAALQALAGAVATATVAQRVRIVQLAIAAGRDVERVLADPGLRAYRSLPVDLAAVAEAAALLDRARVSVELEPGLVVRGDPTRLRQVLANLVANALRHGNRVTVTGRRERGSVVVDVADDGPGLAAGIDAFARGASTAASTGLGLWLARTIAEAHGGTLEHVPAPAGATFRLALPPFVADR
jgi:signal transduction histidine kinase